MKDYTSIGVTADCVTIMLAYIAGDKVEFSGNSGKDWGMVTKVGKGLHEWNFQKWIYRLG